MTPKPILALAGGHTQKAMWPALAEHYRLAFLDTAAANLAGEMGLEGIMRIEGFLDGERFNQAKNEAMWASEKVMAALKNGLVLDHAVPELNSKMPKWLPLFFRDQAEAAMVRLAAVDACFAKEKPVGVLVHEDVTSESRALVLYAKEHGVPTLHLPHANHFLKARTTDIHSQITAEHMAFYGEYMADWYGVPGTRVGAPQWDWLYHDIKIPTKEIARRGMGIVDGTKTLTYATTWFQMTSVFGKGADDLEAAWLRMLEAAKTLKAFLIVKMHPGEQANQEKHYEEGMKKAEVHGAIMRQNTEWALRAADCVIVQGPSNVGVEAAILGTPVVELYQYGARYPEWGPSGTWGEDLVQKIEAATPNPEFVRRILDHPGEATEHAVEWVRGICK